MLNSTEHEICPANKSQINIANSLLLNIAKHENSLFIKLKMPTPVGIFIFISRETSILRLFKHEKSFIPRGQLYQNMKKTKNDFSVIPRPKGLLCLILTCPNYNSPAIFEDTG